MIDVTKPRIPAWLAPAVFVAASIAAEPAAPQLSLTLRGVRDGRIESGEPLAVAVRISLPPRAAAAIELAPAPGGWTDAIHVEIARDAAAAALAKGTVVGRPEATRIKVEAKLAAGGVWLIPASATQGLAPGKYIVRGRLEVERGDGWQGKATAIPLSLAVVAVSNEPARVSQRVTAKAFEAASAGRLEAAAEILDAQLKLTPDDRALLLTRAALSENGGNVPAALALVNRAARGLPARSVPPLELFEMQVRLQKKLLENSPSGESPAWSRLPVFLLPATPTVATNPTPTSAATPTAPAASTTSLPSASPPKAGPDAAKSTAAPRLAPATKPPADGKLVAASELVDATIRADAAGQWAAAAQAKSSYSNPNYGPAKATGAPDVASGGDSIDAWCPGQQNGGTDWLEVTFPRPVKATEIRVRQTLNAGAIAKVEALAEDGSSQVWWEGADPVASKPVPGIVWFAVRVPATDYAVAKVKLTLNLAAVPGWKQIDAVQLVRAP
jgi:hypothetical protein